MMQRLRDYGLLAMGGACAIAALFGWAALAQQPGSGGAQPTPAGLTSINGHVLFSGGNPITSMTGGTIDDGSSDAEGGFLASASSGSITFTVAYNRPPWCDVTSYTGANPATYTVSNAGITLSTITSATRYTWQCFARPGG
jgi:hypothetical protein